MMATCNGMASSWPQVLSSFFFRRFSFSSFNYQRVLMDSLGKGEGEGHSLPSPLPSAATLPEPDMKTELVLDKEHHSTEGPSVGSDIEQSPTSKLTHRSCINYRPGFTSEIFKLEVINVPPFVGFKQLKNRLKNLKLKPIKVKISQSLCFVTFPSEEDRQEAMKVINGHVWKKKKLKAVPAKPAMDPILKRKRQVGVVPDADERNIKKPCLDTRTLEERLNEAITPLVSMPYDDQLSLKAKNMEKFLTDIVKPIKKLNPGKWFTDHVTGNNGLFCHMEPIRSSPVTTEYRNKCEFTIGLGSQNDTVVGFRVGAYKDGDLTVAPPNSCIVPEKTRKIVNVVQDVVQESTLKPFDCQTFDGYWKQLTVRCYTTGQTMVVVHFESQQLSQDIIQKEKQSLLNAFEQSSADIVPTSLYWNTIPQRGGSCSDNGMELLMGTEHVYEEILGVQFRISPDSFFQVNSKATEVLYSTIGEVISGEGRSPLVYDLCCGTGTIGIALSKISNISKVTGIELVQQAIHDAEYNAKSNGLKNAEFICGKVEDTLSSVIAKNKTNDSILAIADPPRGGLHPSVIQAVRRCSSINTLVYVSCNPNGASTNFIDLCRPNSNKIKGLPFRAVKAIPVDLFPHTRHCELVVVFKRVQSTSAIGSSKTVNEIENEGDSTDKVIQ